MNQFEYTKCERPRCNRLEVPDIARLILQDIQLVVSDVLYIPYAHMVGYRTPSKTNKGTPSPGT